jgi:hypothetical protein
MLSISVAEKDEIVSTPGCWHVQNIPYQWNKAARLLLVEFYDIRVCADAIKDMIIHGKDTVTHADLLRSSKNARLCPKIAMVLKENMAEERKDRLPHLLARTLPPPAVIQSRDGRGPELKLPPRNRTQHAEHLIRQIKPKIKPLFKNKALLMPETESISH